jgi:F0F1-type ATP synthase membrane subunit b/b'
VYLVVSKAFAPRIEKILQDRDVLVGSMQQTARQWKNEAIKIAEGVSVDLENAQMDVISTEAIQMESFRKQSLREKDALYDLFSRRSKEESEELIKSAQKAFSEMLDRIEVVAEPAREKVVGTGREKS